MLGFFATAWLLALAVASYAPAVYVTGRGAPIFIAGLAVFLVLLSIGVVRRWRWLFWLILLVFAAGFLRVPATVLQLTGVLPATGPAWYEVVQGAIGIAQVAIAVALWAGYRRAGPWGAF